MSLLISRKDKTLNDAIEVLNEPLIKANNDVNLAWQYVRQYPDQLEFISTELERCLDRDYYLSNYHCIRTENGQIKTMYPYWDHQHIIAEAMDEEWRTKGFCLIIILKPRQCGATEWTSASMFHRTIFTPNAFTLSVAQDDETKNQIFKKMNNAYHYLPWWMRPTVMFRQEGNYIEFQEPNEEKRITNPGLGSAILVEHAQKMTGVAIGKTIRNFHGCLTRNNFVRDKNGFTYSIGDVQVGDRILVPGGDAEVTAVSCRPARDIFPGAEDGYKITSWCNPAFPLEGTGNHKVLCCNGENGFQVEHKKSVKGRRYDKRVSTPKMKKFSDITLKDSLVIPVTQITSDGELPVGELVGHRKHGGGVKSEWHPPEPSREFGFACGLYLAEGNSTNRYVNLALDDDEEHLADRFSKAVGLKYGTAHSKTSRTRHYNFYRSSCRNWFAQNIGHKDTKNMPRWMWSLGREFLLGVVEGMILGDGHISKCDRTISFTTTRAHLALGIREAVCSLGYGYGALGSRDEGFHYGRYRQKIYTVRFGQITNRELRSVFSWEPPLPTKRDMAHWLYSGDKKNIYVNLRKLERVPLDDVYDIEVDTPEHTYFLPAALTHNSEVSRWPDAELFTADIEPSMNADDEYGVLESTAYGRTGLYAKHWEGATKGKNDWRALFVPVYRVRKYAKVGERYLRAQKDFELNNVEKSFNATVKKEQNFEIPNSFWAWRRRRLESTVSSTGVPWSHFESYPITPDEAFQSSGVCAFDRLSLQHQRLNSVCRPLWVGEIKLVSVESCTVNTDSIREVKDGEVLEQRKNRKNTLLFDRLWVWEWPDPREFYYVSSDTALGVIGGDYSVCEVWRTGMGGEPDTQVAEWWGHCPPSEFAMFNAALGIWYHGTNSASEVATEYQGPGITCGDKLKDLDYPNLYRMVHKDRVANAYTNWWHWMTNQKTRDLIIATMNEALLAHTVKIRSEELIDEMYDFGSDEGGGRMEGQDNFDDGVMAAQIGLYCLRETTRDLKQSSEGRDHDAELSGDLNVYGVYDDLRRQRGQYSTKAQALEVIKDKPKWQVIPVMISKANTLYSPIFQGSGPERTLHSKYGMRSTEILPEVVSAFRSAIDTTDYGDDDDW